MSLLADFIEAAKKIEMTLEQLAEQRRSFVYGNTKLANPRITREMVDAIEAALAAREAERDKDPPFYLPW